MPGQRRHSISNVVRLNPLAAYWNNAVGGWGRPCPRPYIHPDDLAYLEKIGYWKKRPHPKRNLNFDSFLQDPSFGRIDSEFHFSLLPLPYMGNLAKADIFV